MKKIIVSVTNDLATDQRVAKVCNSLQKNGFDIMLVGRKLPNSLPINRSYQTKRFKLLFNKGFLFYAEYNFRLFCWLLFTKKDILLSNDLDTLSSNFLVSKIQQKKLVFDSHELFSEIPELVHRPFVKRVWKRLESYLYPKLKNCYTVCNSIADIYNKNYKTDFKVVRNIPTKKEIQKGRLPFTTDKKIIIYQGALNIGRGLELIIEAMLFLDNFILLIIGSGDIEQELQKQVNTNNLEEKVRFLGRLSPEELQKITPLASVGISTEEDLGLNYRYALPNKIFDYIQAEIPILVSNLPEMKQIVLDYNVGEIALNRNPKAIAEQIENICKNDYSNQLKKAKKELIWKNEEQILFSIFENLE